MSSAQAEATAPAEAAAPSDGPASVTAASGPRWLQTLGLHRRELRAWALYDWANSAFATVIGAAVFPIFYANVAAADLLGHEATARYAFTTSVALALVALLTPVLGAPWPTTWARRSGCWARSWRWVPWAPPRCSSSAEVTGCLPR